MKENETENYREITIAVNYGWPLYLKTFVIRRCKGGGKLF